MTKLRVPPFRSQRVANITALLTDATVLLSARDRDSVLAVTWHVVETHNLPEAQPVREFLAAESGEYIEIDVVSLLAGVARIMPECESKLIRGGVLIDATPLQELPDRIDQAAETVDLAIADVDCGVSREMIRSFVLSPSCMSYCQFISGQTDTFNVHRAFNQARTALKNAVEDTPAAKRVMLGAAA